MEITTKEIRGINIKIAVAWIGGTITFVIMGTLWYAGINNAVAANSSTMDDVKQTLKYVNAQRETELKELNQKLDAQQLQLDKLEWEWKNFQDFYDITPKQKK